MLYMWSFKMRIVLNRYELQVATMARNEFSLRSKNSYGVCKSIGRVLVLDMVASILLMDGFFSLTSFVDLCRIELSSVLHAHGVTRATTTTTHLKIPRLGHLIHQLFVHHD